MNAKHAAPKVEEIPQAPNLTQDQVDEIQFPELSKDIFTLGENPFRIRPLPWKWEREFRKHAMPLAQSELKPFERAIKLVAMGEHEIREDLGMTESFVDSELLADAAITECIVVILLSQDETILDFASKAQEMPADKLIALEKKYRAMVEGSERGRKFMREIVRTQSVKIQMVQTLGESLMARFGELCELLGVKTEFDGLRRDLRLRALSFLGKVGRAAGIPGKSSTPSTENGSKTPELEKQPNGHAEAQTTESQSETVSDERNGELVSAEAKA